MFVSPTAVSDLDVESKLTAHFRAPWRLQRNVLHPSTRPACVAELHRQANHSLWSLNQGEPLDVSAWPIDPYFCSSQWPLFRMIVRHCSISDLELNIKRTFSHLFFHIFNFNFFRTFRFDMFSFCFVLPNVVLFQLALETTWNLYWFQTWKMSKRKKFLRTKQQEKDRIIKHIQQNFHIQFNKE